MSDQALSPVATVLAKGKTLGEVLGGLVRPKKAEKPVKVAAKAELTDADKEALALLPQVYGVVRPETRTLLSPAELSGILNERLIIDQVVRFVEKRKEGIRTIVVNHLDVSFEERGQVDESVQVDSDGHYLVMGHHQIPEVGTNQVFSWEVSAGGDPQLNEEKLYDLCHDETGKSGLSHKDWLAMTYVPEVSRRFDEAKALDYIKAHPELLEHLEAAMEVPKPRGALFVRNRKA